jgi:hypothetical protein
MSIFQTLKNIFGFIAEYILITKKQVESVLFTKSPKNWRYGTKGNVILLPGFAETWVFLNTIAECLNCLGYRIFVVKSLGRNVESIEIGLAKVKKLIKTEDIRAITLLSHSKGGITAKMLLDDPKYSKIIKQSIGVAVPYRGSILGYLHIFSLNQLIPGSDVIKKVNNSSCENTKLINIYPKLDNHVIPNRNLFLEGAKNICIAITGHTRILEAKATVDMIVKNIS